MGRFDLTDDEWELIRPVLPRPKATGRPLGDVRRIVNGIGWVVRTGSPWRDAPTEYGSWQTLYRWFAAWRRDGTWDRVVQLLLIRLWEGGVLEGPLWCVDGTIIRATPAAAGARKKGDPRKSRKTMPWAILEVATARRCTGSALASGFLSCSSSHPDSGTNPPSSPS